MTAGTKIFLAVFAVLIGTLVVYYGGVRDTGPTGDASGKQAVAADLTAGTPLPIGPASAPASRTAPARERRKPVDAEPVGSAPPVAIDTGAAAIRPIAGEPPVEQRDAERAAPITMPLHGGPVPSDGGKASSGVRPLPDERSQATRPAEPRRSEPAGADVTTYAVRDGDTLTSIAKAAYGDGRLWSVIAGANPAVDPHRLRVGQSLRIPADPGRAAAPVPAAAADAGPPAPAPRAARHVVSAGETLSSIAAARLGDAKRWRDLYEANRRVIGPDPDALVVGTQLVLPAQ